MLSTDQHPALTFVMSERQLLNVIRRNLPSQRSINKATGLLTMGFGAAEMAGAAGLAAIPEPFFSKMGSAALAAHAADMMVTGQRAWNKGTAPQTLTERAVRAAARMAHAPPAVADLAGAAADALIPGGILHGIGHYAATRAIRVASADASRLTFRQGDITRDHFHRPVPQATQPAGTPINDNYNPFNRQRPLSYNKYGSALPKQADASPRPSKYAYIRPEHFRRPLPRTAQPSQAPANQNLLSPHRQKWLHLNQHEAPLHNLKAGGHVLRKHVSPTDEYIERRFTKEKQPIVSFFTSKEEAERTIHKVLVDNSNKIDNWLKTSRDGASINIESNISGKGTVVINSSNRERKTAQRIVVTLAKQQLNGMSYYVHTIKLYEW